MNAASQRLDRLIGLLIAAATLVGVIYAQVAPVAALTYRTSDDAYYYFQVARQITLGHGPTFDGLNATNGFHPLWLLLLLPVYKLAGADPETGLRYALSVVVFLAGLAAWLAYKLLSRWSDRTAAALLLPLLLLPPLSSALLNGLETGLLLVLLFLLLHACLRRDLLAARAPAGQNVLLGVLLGLIFLTRLDLLFLVLAFFGLFLLDGWRQADRRAGLAGAVRKSFQVGLVFSALALPYLIWNQLTFGSLVPISGQLKSSFPSVTFSPERLLGRHTLFGEVQLALAGLALAILVRTQGWAAVRTRLYAVLVAGAAAHFLNAVLFMPWGAQWWHYAAYLPMTLLAGATLVAGGLARRRPAAVVPLAAGLILAGVAAGLWAERRFRADSHRPWYEAALWARANLPAGAVVGMTDCGIFGYFAQRPTINLDGVINGYAYQRALADGRLTEYLAHCGVTHIADYEARYEDDGYRIRLRPRLYGGAPTAILASVPAEVYRSAPYRHPLSRSRRPICFAIWRWPDLVVVNEDSPASPTRTPPRQAAVLPAGGATGGEGRSAGAAR